MWAVELQLGNWENLKLDGRLDKLVRAGRYQTLAKWVVNWNLWLALSLTLLSAEAKSIRISLKQIVSGFVIPCLLHYCFPPRSVFFKQCLQRSVDFSLVSTLRSYACVMWSIRSCVQNLNFRSSPWRFSMTKSRGRWNLVLSGGRGGAPLPQADPLAAAAQHRGQEDQLVLQRCKP